MAIVQSRVAGLPRADADQLAAELGDLPLAIAQAAAFMATGMGAEKYLAQLRSQAGKLLALKRPDSYPLSLAPATCLSGRWK